MPAPAFLSRLNSPATVAVAAAIVTAAALWSIPIHVIEAWVVQSGLPAILPAAAPPLGLWARGGILIAGVGGVALVVSLVFARMAGPTSFPMLSYRPADDVSESDETIDYSAPQIRRADAHPDAPPRPPLRAAIDLMEKESRTAEAKALKPERPPERPLPTDLDRPLSQYDPGAVPATPATPSESVRPLAGLRRPQVFDHGERFETFALTPPADLTGEHMPTGATASDNREGALAAPQTDASVHALLDRLERGVARRHTRTARTETASHQPADRSALDETLAQLRRMAAAG
ncbi:hypothetical protein [Stakelama saccharophila]|uniref:Uncharacterized protein n=1 Tax=Stakelama saccharophila TaxID=3075605 RepID=A0ABZ0B859_9SPHN|nr:hypothetical protein [Stakelama sp. W311]WNO53296.1 hypothetical protein RPR59_12710 [Stakelama sp. W311]